MVKILYIKNLNDLTSVISYMDKLKVVLPGVTSKVMNKWGKILERDMKRGFSRVTFPFRNQSQNRGIRWEQKKKKVEGYLFMLNRIVATDRMRPHWVSVRRSRGNLLAWAKQAKSPYIRKQASMIERGVIKRFGIYVRPHPFINASFKRVFPRLNPLLKTGLSEVMKV